MERNHRMIDQAQLMQILPELLREGISVPLVITGNSMYPFLKHGRDTVYLSKLQDPVKTGDMILYQRRSGELILHRVVSVEENSFTLLGDRQVGREPGVSPDSVLAVVTAVRRNGKLLRPNHLIWWFFANVWPKILRFRPRMIRLYAFFAGDKEISCL
jgi:hypothetical protein